MRKRLAEDTAPATCNGRSLLDCLLRELAAHATAAAVRRWATLLLAHGELTSSPDPQRGDVRGGAGERMQTKPAPGGDQPTGAGKINSQ
jgi:hypothetical protein